MELVLSADIGGSTTRLRIFEVNTSNSFKDLDLNTCKKLPGNLLFDKKYFNDGYQSLLEVIKIFLKESNIKHIPSTACLAVAGPVKDNYAKLTNRSSWIIDGNAIAMELGIKRNRVINDFLAMGYGILTLDESTECIALQKAPRNNNAPIACIGAGTGLGECFLTCDHKGNYECYPSEGGHAEFAPRNELEIKLLKFLSNKFNGKHRISVERLVSGTGLANIYEFLTIEYPNEINKNTLAQINSALESERGRIIATNTTVCMLCKKTMHIFTSAYGSEAGVAALKWLPYGGLYLTGGLTPKNISYLTGEREGINNLFMESLLDKGRVSNMLHSIPIYAVMVEDLGERGAQYTALKLLQDEMKDLSLSLSINNLTSTTITSSSSLIDYNIFDTIKDHSYIIISSILLSGFMIGTYTWIKCKK